MSKVRFIGLAAATAQLVTITPTAVDNTLYTVTINQKPVTFTSGSGTTVDLISAGLAAALTAAAAGEFREISWADLTGTISGTAQAAGDPFTLSVGSHLSASTTNANVSPADLNNTLNYSTGSLPGNGDSLYFDNMDQPADVNLNALASVNPALVVFASTYTGQVGLPERTGSASSSTSYEEYRPRYFQIGAGTGAMVINVGDALGGQGSGLIQIDTQAGQATLTVASTGNSNSNGNLYPLVWKGTHASNVVTVTGGSLDVAPFGNEIATIATLTVNSGNCRTGAGVTLTNVNMNNGALTTKSAITTATQLGGAWTHTAGTIGTLLINGGTFSLNAGITISTSLTVGPGATLDLTNCPAALVLSGTVTVYGTARILDPNDRIPKSVAIFYPNGFDSVEWTRSTAPVTLTLS